MTFLHNKNLIHKHCAGISTTNTACVLAGQSDTRQVAAWQRCVRARGLVGDRRLCSLIGRHGHPGAPCRDLADYISAARALCPHCWIALKFLHSTLQFIRWCFSVVSCSCPWRWRRERVRLLGCSSRTPRLPTAVQVPPRHLRRQRLRLTSASGWRWAWSRSEWRWRTTCWLLWSACTLPSGSRTLRSGPSFRRTSLSRCCACCLPVTTSTASTSGWPATLRRSCRAAPSRPPAPPAATAAERPPAPKASFTSLELALWHLVLLFWRLFYVCLLTCSFRLFRFKNGLSDHETKNGPFA